MSEKIEIPGSANERYRPLKEVGKGKDGTVFLTIKRDKATRPYELQALKVPDAQAKVVSFLKTELIVLIQAQFENFASRQDHSGWPLPKILGVSPNRTWYVMDHVGGCDIQSLLRNGFYDGLPPSLMFRILNQVYKYSMHLQHQGLYHSDLATGGNVMLHRSRSEQNFSITLIDFEGVKSTSDINERKMHPIVKLARAMTRGKNLVPKGYQQRRATSTFEERDLEDADQIYSRIGELYNKNTWPDGDSMERFWGEWGDRTKELAETMEDKRLVKDIDDLLQTEEEETENNVKEKVTDAGLDKEVLGVE